MLFRQKLLSLAFSLRASSLQTTESMVVMRRALIVVDMSREQMSAVSYRAATVTENCRRLASCEDFDLRIDSKLWLTTPEESSLSWVWPESAKTLFVAGSKGASLIPELADCNLRFVPKNNYSCFANSDLLSILQQEDVSDVYVVGINTDYCVFATAMDAFAHKFRTYVIQDAVTSVRGKAAHEEGLRNLERHFGPDALVSTDDVLRTLQASQEN
jgi:nicotinamidase-related amidase